MEKGCALPDVLRCATALQRLEVIDHCMVHTQYIYATAKASRTRRCRFVACYSDSTDNSCDDHPQVYLGGAPLDVVEELGVLGARLKVGVRVRVRGNAAGTLKAPFGRGCWCWCWCWG